MIGCNVILWPIPWSQCKRDRCTRWWRTPVDWSAHCPCPAVSAISGILLPHHLSNINLQCFTGTVRAQSYLWHRRSLLGFSLLPKFCRLLQQISNMLGGTTWISATNKMLSKFCKPFVVLHFHLWWLPAHMWPQKELNSIRISGKVAMSGKVRLDGGCIQWSCSMPPHRGATVRVANFDSLSHFDFKLPIWIKRVTSCHHKFWISPDQGICLGLICYIFKNLNSFQSLTQRVHSP